MRANTLRTLLDRTARDPELREAQTRAMTTPPISTLLRTQRADGRWLGPQMYAPKYISSHWSNLLLVEYAADPGDARVKRGARRILEDLSAGQGGMGWATDSDHGISCFFGNVVRYVATAGYGADARLQPIVERLIKDARKFDAACVINDEKPCAWGYARLVWGLSALPEAARTRDVERAIRRGVEFLLSYSAERGDYPTATKPSHLWRQLSFPLFYQADVLFVLRAIDAAGAIDDPRAHPAIAFLLSRQDARGRWEGRAPYADRMASKVDASKWVTLQVLGVLKHAFPES
ncbi:MAG: hypothetical protein HY071_00750 [Chloroflexi bacterium]|nr:hypothetical protein [Chloroflexota bacterium]